MTIALIVILAVGIGAAVFGFKIWRKLASVRALLSQRDRELDRVRTEAGRIKDRSAAELRAERARASENIALINEAKTKLTHAFASASQGALAKNNRIFLDLARTKLGEFQADAKADLSARQHSITGLVRPVLDGIAKVGAALQRLDVDRAAGRAAIDVQLQSIVEHSKSLAGETRRLVRALRTPAVRGKWGEMQLRRVVELAGMVEHVDYTEQPSIATEDGQRRPDLLIHLPGGKKIVIDSKVPMESFLDSAAANDESERKAALQRHARQVRQHVSGLAAKQYQKHVPDSPDFVLMFLPGEALLAAAFEADPDLIEWATAKGVIPASPISLIALLRAVAFGWKQEKLNDNAAQLRDLGRTLYDRIRTMTGHFQSLKTGLEASVKAFNRTVGSLESRVLPTARKFGELGLSVDSEIQHLEPIDETPRQLRDEAADIELSRRIMSLGAPPDVT